MLKPKVSRLGGVGDNMAGNGAGQGDWGEICKKTKNSENLKICVYHQAMENHCKLLNEGLI